MSDTPKVIISAFADEAANRKTAIEQMVALAACGLKYYSPRFMDVAGTGNVKHVVELDATEFDELKKLHEEFGMSVTSIGSRVGKIKLKDVDDGSHNKYVEIGEYIGTELAATIAAAKQLDTKLIRGFSFYHPRGTNPQDHIQEAAASIKQIVEACASEGLIYGLEIEPNLVGETGGLLAELSKAVDHPNMVLIWDGGNVAAQNKNPVQCVEEYKETRDNLGWMHIKDYRIDPSLVWDGAVDEERLKNFVPCNVGDAGHEATLRDLKDHLPALTKKVQAMGVPGFFLETEPHLKGGGQFGGFSGPDGMGVAVRALCSVLDYVGIDYDLRSFDDIRSLRGF